MPVPYEYDYINAANSARNPSTMHAHDTGLARFFRRYLLQKAISVFEFDLPEEWPENYFEYVLFVNGFLAVIETDKYGVIPQMCTLGGYNVYYQPTRAIISSPALVKVYDARIGIDTEIIQLSPDYCGIYDLVCYYADLLAVCAEGAGVNILNSKLAYVFAAKNKASAESFKKLFDNVASGEPATTIDKSLLDDDGKLTWFAFSQNLKQNFIAPDILQTMRMIEQEFDTVIGIPNANTDKKERLISDEVNANNLETYSRPELWLRTMKAGIDKVNDMFGLDLDVRIRGLEEMEAENVSAIDAIDTGNVPGKE